MNFKYIYFQILLVVSILFLISCNEHSEYDISTASSDSQITYFSVISRPLNAADSLVYDYLPKTFFTILSSESAGYDIFNQDSLPVRTRIGTMKVNMSYTNTPNKIDLLYLDSLRVDSVVSWNSDDSIKFIYDNQHKIYYPKITIVAPDALNKRTYTVNFRVHKLNPDSIAWNIVTTSSGDKFILPKKGESKTIANDEKSEFYSLIKSNGIIYFYKSSVLSPNWNLVETTTLPSNAVISSMTQLDNQLYVITEDGKIYFAKPADYDGWKLIENSLKVKSIAGILPIDDSTQSNNYIITYYNAQNKLAIAKTSDFVNIEDVSISGKLDNLVEDGFPVNDFSNLYISQDYKDYLLLLGGTDKNEKISRSTWYISTDIDKENSIVVMPGKENKLLPYSLGVTGFFYDEKVQALSADSLSLYSSKNGQVWTRQEKTLRLPAEMKTMNKPSIVVDNDNYIWVFGGYNNTANKDYSQQIWKGRINSLSTGYIRE